MLRVLMGTRAITGALPCEPMTELCEELRTERQERAISLEAMEQRTKIPGRHLRALEEGRLQDLPGGIFRKGILRGYLDTLGLPSEPWMGRFEACLATLPADAETTDLTAFAEGVQRSRPARERVDAFRWPGVLAMMAVLLLFGWCIWRFALRDRLVISGGGVQHAVQHTGAGSSS